MLIVGLITATLSLSGSLTLQAPNFPPSAAQSDGAPISETLNVQAWDQQAPTLGADGFQAVPFPIGMTLCHFLQIKVLGGSPIQLQISSANGNNQIIPVDSFISLFMFGTPATAISVARTPGVTAQLVYTIAQSA